MSHNKVVFQKLIVPGRAKVDHESLSLFQKILLMTDGTVTDLLVLYAGEPIKVNKVEQKIMVGGAPEALCCPADAPILKRIILLSGLSKNYLYAESFFIFEKLSRNIQYKLLESDIPIGLLWKKENTEMFRQMIECKAELCEVASAYFDQDYDTPMLSRTYVLLNNQQPFGIINEKFPITCFKDIK